MATTARLKFGWTKEKMEEMPPLAADGFKISREKVWSANARRTSSAKFTGTLVARKVTLDMAFPANLTGAQIDKLMTYADPDPKDKSHKFCFIEFTNEKGNRETAEFYFGNPTFDAHVFLNGKYLWSSIQIQAVER